jgi:hypothetical protein
MAPQEKLRKRISELVSRRKNVECEEIEWVLKQINAIGRKARHGVIYKIPGCTSPLMLNEHNNGKDHLPPDCVDGFRDRMAELGLYAPDENETNEND